MNLIERMRGVRTVGDNHPIYENAEISIKEFSPCEVKPTSKYVLRKNLRRLNKLRKKMKARGDNLFEIDSLVEEDDFPIAPPIVENDGQENCIIDGLHRFTIAKIKGERVRTVYIKGANRQMIGYPIEWDDIKIRREKPDTAEECRDLRVEDKSDTLRHYYRDFGFLGSSGRRPRKGQSG